MTDCYTLMTQQGDAMHEYRVRRIADSKYLLIDDYGRDVWVDRAIATIFPDPNTAAEHCRAWVRG
jgi:hypothetical protein